MKLVETGLVFGVDGFVSYEAKKFNPKMKMTKRYYPHKYNVDGFFVSKFKKTGPLPASATVAGSQEINGGPKSSTYVEEDKRPIVESDGEVGTDGDEDFGGWDDEEDKIYVERARRRRLKKKGINPKASKKGSGTINGVS